MTVQINARVVVSVTEGKIEIEGSEQFVAEQMERLNNVICLVVTAAGKPSSEPPAKATLHDSSMSSARSFGRFANLYAHRDGKIQLLKELPGSNMAHKTISAALLVSHANSLLGTENTPLEVIRKACKEHACHDSNNFAATLKREKELFTHSGGSHITLSEAGKTLAATMADQLIGA